MTRADRLSAFDAALLHFVSEVGFSHTGSLTVADGHIPFDEYVADLEIRVRALPRFRQIALDVPFNIAYPTWETDPNYRFADHVEHVRLDRPGTREQLLERAAELYSIQLRKDRPYWFVYLITGLEGNRSAVLLKVHHAITDGMGAEEIVRAVFGKELPKGVYDPSESIPVRPVPSARVWSGLRDNARTGLHVAARFPASTLAVLHWMFSNSARQTVRIQLDYMRAPGLRFPFNAPCSGKIKLATTQFILEDLRIIGRACNATVNDVLLAVVSKAMQSYARSLNLDVKGKFLRVQIPVSLRKEKESREMGNVATIAGIPIPLDVEDATELVRVISRSTREIKESKAPLAMNRLISALLFCITPIFAPYVQRRAASLNGQRKKFKKQGVPGTTLVVSNIARGSAPLYVAGRHVVLRHGIGSPVPNIGIGCVAMTSGIHLAVTFAANAEGAAGLERVVEMLERAFEELRSTVVPATPAA